MRDYRLAFSVLILIAASAASGEAHRVQVHFPTQSGHEPASDLLVYERAYRGPLRLIGQTDELGQVTTTCERIGEVGDLGQRNYVVIPHNPKRWSLEQISITRRPTSEFEPNTYRKPVEEEVLSELGQRLNSRWAEVDGKVFLETDPVPPTTIVRLRARGRDGKPLRERPILLYSADRFSRSRAPVWTGVTDDQGVCQIRQFSGIHSWIVCFPGLGFTQTGSLLLEADAEVTVNLNRPVAYGRISGRIDEHLQARMTPNSWIHLSTNGAWQYREVQIDDNWRFTIEDVPAGQSYRLQIGMKKSSVAIEPLRLAPLLPGEHRDGLLIEPPGEQAASYAKFIRSFNSQRNKLRDWRPTLRGRVVDPRGKAIEGAAVFAILKHHGGIRMYQKTEELTTDSDGFYEVPEANFHHGSVALIASVPGKPLAIAAGGYSGEVDPITLSIVEGGASVHDDPRQPLPAVLTQPDLVVPDAAQGGSLRVVTLHDGKPVEGVRVGLRLMDFYSSFSPRWAHGGIPQTLNELLAPSANTNSDGVATFSNLIAGHYQVTASGPIPGKTQPVPLRERYTVSEGPKTSANFVAVAAGHTRDLQMYAASEGLPRVPFTVAHPGEANARLPGCETSWSSRLHGGWRSGSDFSERGIGTIGVERRGLWNLGIRYLSPSLGNQNRVSQRTEPYYEGHAVVAVSDLAPRQPPIEFHPRLAAPGRISAVIEDEQGAPVQGVVSIDWTPSGSYGQQETRFATTDDQGRVLFERVQSGSHKIKAWVQSMRAPKASWEADDAAFEGQFAFPESTVDLEQAGHREVRLRRQQVAYIRGKIIVPEPGEEAERAPLSIRLPGHSSNRELPTTLSYSQESQEFCLGPVVPGDRTIWIEQYDKGKQISPMSYTFAAIRPGVHHEDVRYTHHPTRDPKKAALERHGIVLRPDGKTPAFAARIAAYTPGLGVRQSVAWTNAKGQFRVRAASFPTNQFGATADLEVSPPRTAIVAFLPGELGATVAHLSAPPEGRPEHEVRIVLPPPCTIRGEVTVAGESPTGLPGTISLLARHSGAGKLDDLLSVHLTANADGSYELAGLTPGEYQVQAAIDNIWISGHQSVKVPDGKEWELNLNFDIPKLGGLAQYRLIDQSGKPAAHLRLRLLDPKFTGPLGTSLRPWPLQTDATGILHLEGFCAGDLQIETQDGAPLKGITIPPIGEPMEEPSAVRID